MKRVIKRLLTPLVQEIVSEQLDAINRETVKILNKILTEYQTSLTSKSDDSGQSQTISHDNSD